MDNFFTWSRAIVGVSEGPEFVALFNGLFLEAKSLNAPSFELLEHFINCQGKGRPNTKLFADSVHMIDNVGGLLVPLFINRRNLFIFIRGRVIVNFAFKKTFFNSFKTFIKRSFFVVFLG